MKLVFAAMLLIGSAASAHAAPQVGGERSADNRDKIICKRFVRTGSLVDGYRTCKSKWEWDRERENIRQLHVVDSCGARGSGAGCK